MNQGREPANVPYVIGPQQNSPVIQMFKWYSEIPYSDYIYLIT